MIHSSHVLTPLDCAIEDVPTNWGGMLVRDGFRDGALDMRSGVNAEVILWAIGAGLERSQQAVVTS